MGVWRKRFSRNAARVVTVCYQGVSRMPSGNRQTSREAKRHGTASSAACLRHVVRIGRMLPADGTQHARTASSSRRNQHAERHAMHSAIALRGMTPARRFRQGKGTNARHLARHNVGCRHLSLYMLYQYRKVVTEYADSLVRVRARTFAQPAYETA